MGLLCVIKKGTNKHIHKIHRSPPHYRAASTDFPDPLSPPFSIVIAPGRSSWLPPVSAQSCRYVLAGLPTLARSCEGVYIAYEFALTSPTVSRMSGSFNLDGFRDGWLVAVQLLFCGMLPPGLVQYSSKHYWIIAVKLFLHTLS